MKQPPTTTSSNKKIKPNRFNLKEILIIGLIVRLVILILSSSHPDIGNHLDWGIRFLDLGPKKFYENIFWAVSWPNQPYGTILLFALTAYLKNSLFSFIELINQNLLIFPSFIIPYIEINLQSWMAKLPFILSDIGIGYLIYKIVHNYKKGYALLATVLFVFNPVIIYNSTVWGQTDSLINLLALSGIYLIFNKKYFYGIFLFLTSFLFKLSLIIYLPILGLLLLKRIKDWKQFILPVITFTLFVYLLAIPFTFGAKNPFQWIWYMYTNRVLVRQGSMLNGNAFNFWFLLFGLDFSKSEFTTYTGISYQLWSRLFFILTLIPISIKFLKSKLTLNSLLTALLLSSFSSFLFLTNMHERYLYPILPIFVTLIFINKIHFQIKEYILISFLHLLNLYNLWFYPEIAFLKNTLMWDNFLVGRFVSLLFIIYFVIKYKQYLTHENK
jgi:Gpi18-like mannosyltransferase